MRIGVLGPLEVRTGDGTTVTVAGTRLRTLLILLALEPGRLVPTTRLIDGIWGAHPPAGAANALQALVSRLRRALPEAAIEPHPAGYRLVIEPDAVDAVRFERLVAAGRFALPDDPATAARVLREALDLWRGPALLDVAGAVSVQGVITHLSELRLAATEDRIEADLRRGGGGELATELAALVDQHPLRERLVGAWMRALAAAGRPAEALTVYERARQALAEALGTDPSPELSALHTAILRGELGRADEPPRTNLRAGLTSFVGRDDDVAEVRKLVHEHRLTTLTGPGGSGKTRLAVEAARGLLEQAPDGVWLVELAPVGDAADLPQAVLAALGLREQAVTGWMSAGEPLDRLAAALRTGSTLLVLDNCEHLIDAAAALADRLLGECPYLRILATSREPLGITGEALWPVEPLAAPPEGADVAEAKSYPAVRLLDDRAGAARPGFAITEQTLPAVVRICRALDGMPLAIELAAARLRTMTPAQLAAGLDDRFRLLTGGSRTALPRHQTLRAVVDWSWQLLSDRERTLLRRLAIFSGGATVEAAERVCGFSESLLDLLTGLVDKSLLIASDGEPARYRMLETIRAYCLDRLDQAGERDRLRRAHADYFAELAESAEPHLRRAEQLVWLRRLAADQDNISAALRGAIAAGDAQTAVRLAAALGWYWWLSGRKAEGAELAAAALAVPGDVDDEARATVYAMSAMVATAGAGDWQQAEAWLEAAAPLAERAPAGNPVLRMIGPMRNLLRGLRDGSTDPVSALDPVLADEDPWMRAGAHLNRADLLRSTGRRSAEAESDVEAAVAGFRATGERWGIAYSLAARADLAAQRCDLAAALGSYEQAIAAAAELGSTEDVMLMRARQAQLRWLGGDPAGAAAAMAEAERDAAQVGWPDALAFMAHAKAELARWAGDTGTARAELARAEAVLEQISVHPLYRATILVSRAYLDAQDGDLDAARAHWAEALDQALEFAEAQTLAQVLVGVADLALRLDRPREAAQLLAASVTVRGTPDLSNPDAVRVEQAARAALGEPVFTEAARAGQQLTIRQLHERAAGVVLADPG